MARRKPREPDAIEIGATAADGELTGVFHDLASAVRFQDFDLRLDEFRLLRRLAMLDRFGEEDDGAKADRLELDAKRIEALRASEAYPEMVARLDEEWQRLKRPRTIQELVKDERIQDEVFRRTVRLARSGVQGADLPKYLDAFNDRAMPRIQKDAGTKVLMISMPDVHRIQQVEAEVFGELGEGAVIEGEVEDG